jgi:hypothetical protein
MDSFLNTPEEVKIKNKFKKQRKFLKPEVRGSSLYALRYPAISRNAKCEILFQTNGVEKCLITIVCRYRYCYVRKFIFSLLGHREREGCVY